MSKVNVLRKKEDFDKIYRLNKSSGSRYVVLLFRKNDLPINRRAFLASKKVGNSVKRNRARRLMREAFRQIEADVPQGYDLLMIARNTIIDAKCQDVKLSLIKAFERAGIVKK